MPSYAALRLFKHEFGACDSFTCPQMCTEQRNPSRLERLQLVERVLRRPRRLPHDHNHGHCCEDWHRTRHGRNSFKLHAVVSSDDQTHVRAAVLLPPRPVKNAHAHRSNRPHQRVPQNGILLQTVPNAYFMSAYCMLTKVYTYI